MCFDQKSSFAFAGLGLFLSWYVYSRTYNTRLAIGVFWFFLMEFLQGFQYFFIDDCSNWWNQVLTFIGFVHICYQPYFTHIINSSLTKNPKFLDQYNIILRMCLLGGTLLLARYLMVFFGFATSNVSSDFTDWRGVAPLADTCRTTEWLRGETLCTFRGKYHLAWSVPMSDVSYWTPSAAIHSFLMFGPFFIMKRNMMIQGIFLWLAGPYLASWITANLMEQASIWCFFSIAQIGIMLFIIREQLLLNWGRSKKKVENGAANGHSNGHSAPATSEKPTANKTTSSKKKGGKAKAK